MPGDEPDLPKLARHQIDGLYFDPRDERIDKAYLLRFRSMGFKVGIYTAWNWPEVGSTPESYAMWTFAQTKRLTDGRADQPRVQLDAELHDADYMKALLDRYRALDPSRALSWTLEGLQGGWLTPDLVATILKTKTRIAPQCYSGAMWRFCEDAVLRDLLGRGLPASSISLVYDAAQLAEPWQGWAYHQGRLP